MNRILLVCASAMAMVASGVDAQTAQIFGTIVGSGYGQFADLGPFSGQNFTLDFSYQNEPQCFGGFCTGNITSSPKLLVEGLPTFPGDIVTQYFDQMSNITQNNGYQNDNYGSDSRYFFQGDYPNVGFFSLEQTTAIDSFRPITVFDPDTGESFQIGVEYVGTSRASLSMGVQQDTGLFRIFYDQSSDFVPSATSGFELFASLEGLTVDGVGLFPESPFLPIATLPDGSFVFVYPVQAGVPRFFDPPVSVGYDFAVAPGDPLIASAMFPSLLGDTDGFDIFELGTGGSLLFANVMGGQWVDFTSLQGYANGISGFSLRDINPALMLDPTNPTAFVTGLTFATSGTVNLTQTPVTIEFPIPGGTVPEPASWAMMIAGFGLVGAAARRRRVAVVA